MPMPETPLYKNDSLIFWQANIRRTRKSPDMQPIAESASMQIASHFHFWLSIFAADFGHHAGAGLFIDYVSHSW
ncbi:hypothetical protein MIZ01_2659 [Sideroxyarcus emersonii]|uniref:Uncharacterized protein n=1 Tax=Sideroxyarcus emersonii TaxID=2764705 RepID=A0AAN2C079_9PROT|nr:hypothetical protein MIZ01_2659 [Sideroxyarcus emersonii]